MKRYRVLINGVNFLLEVDGALGKHGFYTSRWVEAEDPQSAELRAIELFRSEPGLRERLRNAPDDPPTLYVEETEEVMELEPAQGLAFYVEEETVHHGTLPTPD